MTLRGGSLSLLTWVSTAELQCAFHKSFFFFLKNGMVGVELGRGGGISLETKIHMCGYHEIFWFKKYGFWPWIFKLLSSKFQVLNGKDSAHGTLTYWTVNSFWVARAQEGRAKKTGDKRAPAIGNFGLLPTTGTSTYNFLQESKKSAERTFYIAVPWNILQRDVEIHRLRAS